MHNIAINSIYVASSDLEAVSRSYQRLGMLLSPNDSGRRSLYIGDGANQVAMHFVAEVSPGSPLAGSLRAAHEAGRASFAFCLRVHDLASSLSSLQTRSVIPQTFQERGIETAWLALHDSAGVDLMLTGDRETAISEVSSPLLKRLDHLAVVTHDLDAKCRFWEEQLNIPVVGEVITTTLVIRQLRIGDAIVELLGAASRDSPIHQRPAGLVSMASWEVMNMPAAVETARQAGFTVPDPAPGPLPGTRITTIPGNALGGVNMQLLEYV